MLVRVTIAEMQYHDRGNLQKKVFHWGLLMLSESQSVIIKAENVAAGRQGLGSSSQELTS